jgi:hypothetical protein
MTEQQRDALAKLHFESALTPESVWNSAQVHVPGLHPDAEQLISSALADARESTGSSPIGVVVNGPKGSGKTHMLGWVRQRLLADGGYFFLSNLGSSEDFWDNMVDALVQGLTQKGADGLNQLDTFLRDLSGQLSATPAVTDAVLGKAKLTPERLDEFIGALRRVHPQVGQECQDAARALVLYACGESRVSNVGYDYLTAPVEMRANDRAKWGFRTRPHNPRRVVSDVSKLLATTGPSVVAVDQIDTLIAAIDKTTTEVRKSSDDGTAAKIAQIADGLMLLREQTRRTLTIVACLPNSWRQIETNAVSSVVDRFRETQRLSRIPEVAVGRELVVSRLAQTFDQIGFTPPTPTWPVAPSAFDSITAYTPREVLNRIDRHIEECLRTGEIGELRSFAAEPPGPSATVDTPSKPSTVDLSAFDSRFAELKRAADVAAPLSPESEDRVMPGLLSAALTAWVAECGGEQRWSVDPLPGAKPSLHARLRLTLNEDLEDQEHWSFRAVAAVQPRAAVNRLDKACAESGIRLGVPGRTLVVIRNIQWSQGRVTQECLTQVEKSGGVSIPITEDDLRTFTALRQMLDERGGGLYDWLAVRRPASGTELFEAVLPKTVNAEPVRGSGPEPVDAGSIPVGHLVADDAVVPVTLESLRKHVVIFAGSGSGKTVLIRRLVEECALQGVSSIVLDVNNDLARLGDPWPEPPADWKAGDEDKAGRYLSETDVVVWTPGQNSGRQLTFPPLPDFGSMLNDTDEFEFAVKAAVGSLAPRAGIGSATPKARLAKAVLDRAIAYYGKSGGRSLDGLIEILSDLPEDVSEIANASALAGNLAQALRAAKVNDPLLAGTTANIDPGMLLTPAAGKRARVSVVNLEGLPALEEKQGFANQLMLELFAWTKRNPVADRPLGGLLVLDEGQDYAPSTGNTPSSQTSIRLASQARKYGLGLVFATQAPKGLHNRITGNATTQFFGRLNHPGHIEAARSLARAKGKDLTDLGRLEPAQFHVTGEGLAFQKVRAPLCLSHHPPAPLTQDEVLERARRGQGSS